MMAAWATPYKIATVIRWHHIEDRSKSEKAESKNIHHLIDIVCVANLLANKLEIGHSGHYTVKSHAPNFLNDSSLMKINFWRSKRKFLRVTKGIPVSSPLCKTFLQASPFGLVLHDEWFSMDAVLT